MITLAGACAASCCYQRLAGRGEWMYLKLRAEGLFVWQVELPTTLFDNFFFSFRCALLNLFLFNWNQMITLALSSNEVYHLVDDIGHRPLLSKGWWAMTHHLALFVRPPMLRNSGCWRPTTFPFDVVVSMVIESLIMHRNTSNSWISKWTFGFTGLTTPVVCKNS